MIGRDLVDLERYVSLHTTSYESRIYLNGILILAYVDPYYFLTEIHRSNVWEDSLNGITEYLVCFLDEL